LSGEEAPEFPHELFTRQDESDDAAFYGVPRFVVHIDDVTIEALTQVYRELLPPRGSVLDLMSSWVSHLPEEVSFGRVAGLGMNELELAKNPRLTDHVVHDLNRLPELPYEDASFDAVVNAVSIQYLTRPVEVLRELGRVIKPRGPLIVTFSNRCFATKAVGVWLALSDTSHGELIEHYLTVAENWTTIERHDRSPAPGKSDPLYAVTAASLGSAA